MNPKLSCWSPLGNSDLVHKVLETPLCDTHEHLQRHTDFTSERVDILGALFENYVIADLIVAGASSEAVDDLFNPEAGSVAERFRAVEEAWSHCRHTGYGEGVRLAAEHFYGLEELTPATLTDAQGTHAELMRTRTRLQILQEDAHLDHVQIDDFTMEIVTDEEDSNYFLYDISLWDLVVGKPDADALGRLTGEEVTDLRSVEAAVAKLFERFGSEAVACKTQHAYVRTLAWQKRDRDDAARLLDRYLKTPKELTPEEHNLLGDWFLDVCSGLASEHSLPIKIHTGYYAGHSRMPLDFISCEHLCGLLAAHPDTDFVLMHNSYPYSMELAALAKHYPNAYVDMCWAWSINPLDASNFLRHAIHSVPANKVFVFGADTSWPIASYAYAMQARYWLTYTLQREVEEGHLSEREAMAYAERMMHRNQYDCFARLQRREATH